MRLVTSEQMRSSDRLTIAGFDDHAPVASRTLMERAGWGIYAALRQHFARLAHRPIFLFCGPGNNGGDGFVVARHLHHAGCAPHALLLGDPERLSHDCAQQRAAYVSRGGAAWAPCSENAIDALVRSILRSAGSHPPLLIDALLGTGSHGAPRGLIAAGARAIQRLKIERGAETLAIDLPTGMDADTGQADGIAVEADLTVTMAFLKTGFLFYPGRALVGRARVVDIGIPDAAAEQSGPSTELITRQQAARLLPEREPDVHKSRVGRVLVVGGSPGLTGAPSMAGLAAQRAGSGLVTIALPASLNPAIEAKLTEVMTLPCAETPAGALSQKALEKILSWAERTDVWALGPGLGSAPESVALVRLLAERFPGPVVVDADALRALRDAPIARPKGAPVPVLTPHPGEMAALLGREPGEGLGGTPVEIARSYAVDHGCVLVLKGAPTLVAAPDGRMWINPTGNPGLATGGSGDVLTGILASLLGQGLDPTEAARLGVFVHGWAADLLAGERGPDRFSPMDVIEILPRAVGSLRSLPAASGHLHGRPNEAWTEESGFQIP